MLPDILSLSISRQALHLILLQVDIALVMFSILSICNQVLCFVILQPDIMLMMMHDAMYAIVQFLL